ncbi:MAG: hypothetical protein QM661_07250 [Solimonas sp.]
MSARGWLCAMLVAGASQAAFAAGTIGSRPLQDLYYGDVLFHYFQRDEFEAIGRLLAARQQGRAAAHADDGELLLGGMLLAFGQTADAQAIFEKQLRVETRAEPRNRAWLALARLQLQRGAADQALRALGQIDAALPGDFEADRQMLTAQALIDLQRYDEAARQLAQWQGAADWRSYAEFNLGVALLRAGRSSEGREALDRVGAGKLDSAEQRALRDRANTALAFAALEAGDHADARRVLQRVRLEGPSSNKALLALGWAESGLGHDRQALVSWQELAQRDAGDPAVDEALLAVPYAMQRLGARQQAAAHCQQAIERFEAEIARVDGVIAGLRRDGLVERLLAGDDPQGLAADWRIERLPASPDSAYLYALIASEPFEQALRSYRQVRFLRVKLTEAARDDDALANDPALPPARVAAFRARLDEQAAQLQRLDAAGAELQARYRDFLLQQAVAQLQQRQQRLRDYQAEAHYTQAQLYDASAGPAETPR